MRRSDTQQLLSGKAAPLRNVGHIFRRLRIDGPLLGGILLICALGLVVLYSAVGENMRLWTNQVIRLGVALIAMIIAAQMSPRFPETLDPMGLPGWHCLAGAGPGDG